MRGITKSPIDPTVSKRLVTLQSQAVSCRGAQVESGSTANTNNVGTGQIIRNDMTVTSGDCYTKVGVNIQDTTPTGLIRTALYQGNTLLAQSEAWPVITGFNRLSIPPTTMTQASVQVAMQLSTTNAVFNLNDVAEGDTMAQAFGTFPANFVDGGDAGIIINFQLRSFGA